MLPASSRASTVSTFVPSLTTIPLADQLVVPLAVPLPPRLFAHVTWVTPTLSDAAPPSVRSGPLVLYVEPEVSKVIAMVGGIVSSAMPVPVRIRERVSPSATKLTFVVAIANVVGVKRTVTAWVAPTPTRLNGLPEVMLKGADVDTVPDTVPPPVFYT